MTCQSNKIEQHGSINDCYIYDMVFRLDFKYKPLLDVIFDVY